MFFGFVTKLVFHNKVYTSLDTPLKWCLGGTVDDIRFVFGDGKGGRQLTRSGLTWLLFAEGRVGWLTR